MTSYLLRCSGKKAMHRSSVQSDAWSFKHSWEREVWLARSMHVQVMVHIAEKLQQLHAAGWTHRDLKPGNAIWLPSKNSWTLIDFGCAARIGAPPPPPPLCPTSAVAIPTGSTLTDALPRPCMADDVVLRPCIRHRQYTEKKQSRRPR